MESVKDIIDTDLVIPVPADINFRAVKNLIEKTDVIIDFLKERLRQFVGIPYKHIIYGGDFGGELAINLMDEVYGRNNFIVYAVDMPCYDDRLREFINRSLNNRQNIVNVKFNDECKAEFDRGNISKGECSKILNVLSENDLTPGLEVCGCFYPSGSLEDFLSWHKPLLGKDEHSEYNKYWGLREREKKQRISLHLFAQIPEQVCNFLAFSYPQTKSQKDWDWWRVHACKTGDFVESGGADEQYIWRNFKGERLDQYHEMIEVKIKRAITGCKG